MSREWRFISAMAPTAVPVAVPLAYCADAGVTGADFYVMEYVDGQVLSDRDAGLALAPEARATAAEQVVDVLVALHALDPAEVGLEDLVRRTGYVERQLRRWHAQMHAAETAEHTSPQALALLDEVHGLLARHVPAQGNGVVHGDFRPGNMAFGSDDTVRAVFDGYWRPPVTRWPTWAGWRQPGRTQGTRSAHHPGAEHCPRVPAARRDGGALRPGLGPGRVGPFLLGGVLPVAFGLHRRRGARPVPEGRMADDGYLRQALNRADDGIRLAEAAVAPSLEGAER